MDTEFLTVQQVANWLRVSHTTAWRLKDNLDARDTNGVLRVPVAAVRAFIADNTVPNTPEEPAMLPTDVATDGLSEFKLYTLAEVHEVTGFPLSSLERACRAREIRHTHFGKQRRMSAEHIRELVASREKGGDETGTDPAVAAVIERVSKRGTSTKRSPAKRAAAA